MRKLIALILLTFPVAAEAQRKKPEPPPKRQHFEFDDDVVTGANPGAEGSTVTTLRAIKRSSLIKIRENFQSELMATAERL
jgi:hypothetical protein